MFQYPSYLPVIFRPFFQRIFRLGGHSRTHLGNQKHPVRRGEFTAQRRQVGQDVGGGIVPAELVADILRNNFHALPEFLLPRQQAAEPFIHIISGGMHFPPHRRVQINHKGQSSFYSSTVSSLIKSYSLSISICRYSSKLSAMTVSSSGSWT